MPEAPGTKVCVTCEIEKPIDDFGILKSAKDGHNPMCLECRREYFRDVRERETKKIKIPDRKPKTDGAKISELPKKQITAQQVESAESQLIKDFKKAVIKSFIRDDLIPMLQKAAEEA